MRVSTGVISIMLLAVLVGASIGLPQSAEQLAQRAFPSVVLLVMQDAHEQPVALGSGFFVRDSLVATNLHVIRGASRGYAKLVGQATRFPITGVAAADPQHDLALLRVAGASATVLPLADGASPSIGDAVYAVGNPEGLEGTFSAGIISGIRKTDAGTLLQITAPISPGSSGGPVLDSRGEVIGLAAATFTGGQNLNFAIPVSYLAGLLDKTGAVVPLSAAGQRDQERSALSSIGGPSTEGVVAEQFAWEFPGQNGGFYSFSLRNRLQSPVKEVSCLVVFYDRRAQPVDFDVVRYSGTIPAELAKRMAHNVDGSVQGLANKIAIRVLDFKISE